MILGCPVFLRDVKRILFASVGKKSLSQRTSCSCSFKGAVLLYQAASLSCCGKSRFPWQRGSVFIFLLPWSRPSRLQFLVSDFQMESLLGTFDWQSFKTATWTSWWRPYFTYASDCVSYSSPRRGWWYPSSLWLGKICERPLSFHLLGCWWKLSLFFTSTRSVWLAWT